MTTSHETENVLTQNLEENVCTISLEELDEALQKACAQAKWTKLTPIQAMAIPSLLAGRDCMVQSKTGSGKTGCYLLPLLARLKPRAEVQALILVPTRELAVQVEHEMETLFAQSGLCGVAIYGGVRFAKQVEALQKGANVVVGTPGRILDHLMRHTLNLSKVTELVLDEADRMLSIGFYPDMQEIKRMLAHEPLHTTFFSATYPPHVLRLADEFLQDPLLLSLSQKEVHVAAVEHCFCSVRPMDKDRALVRLLETENPASALIFCNTRANVQFLTAVLQGFGYSCEGLSADLPQNKREAVLQRIRSGATRYVVATDLASRGLDIPDLSHVFLYEPPEDPESYIHRAGRTGRAGAAGTVISLTDVMERMELERIARQYHIALQEIALPDDALVASVVSERLKTLLASHYRTLSALERERINRYLPLARALAGEVEENDGIMLLGMLLDRFHREWLPKSPLPQRTTAQKRRHKSKRRTKKTPRQEEQKDTSS